MWDDLTDSTENIGTKPLEFKINKYNTQTIIEISIMYEAGLNNLVQSVVYFYSSDIFQS